MTDHDIKIKKKHFSKSKDKQTPPPKSPPSTPPSKPTSTPAKKQKDEDAGNMSDLFADMEDIVLEVTEEIPEYQRVYKDQEIYRRDLENQLLNDLPIYQQNSNYWQRKITEHVEQILELHRMGQDIMLKGGLEEYYKLYDDYLNNRFTQSWIIPIVLDSKKIYRKINEDKPVDMEQPASEYTTDAKITTGITLVDQKKELYDISELRREFRKKQITYDRYLQLLSDLTRPYVPVVSPPPVGYNLNLSNYLTILRFYNLDTINWEERVAAGPYYTYAEDKQKGGFQSKLAVQGENINLVGFMILPQRVIEMAEDDCLQCLHGDSRSVYELYPKNNQGKFGKIGSIENISKSKNAIITLTDHGFSANTVKIFIKDADTSPNINGEYTSIQILDKDRFVINVDFSNGTIDKMGDVYGFQKLPMEERWLHRDKTQFYVSTDKEGKKKLDMSLPEIDKEKAYVYYIDNMKILKEDYEKILSIVIPKLESILEVESANLESITMIKRLDDILDLYGLNVDDLTADAIAKWKTVMSKNINIELKNIERQHLEFDKDKDVDEKNTHVEAAMKDSEFILADQYFYLPDIIAAYGQYPLKNTPHDSIWARMTWLNKSRDRGGFYTTYVNEKIQKDSKKTLLSKLDEMIEILHTELKNNKTAFEKEYKIHKFFDTECQKNSIIYDTIADLQNDKTGKYPDGARAIVKPLKENLDSIVYELKPDSWKALEPSIYKRENGAWIIDKDSTYADFAKHCLLGEGEMKDLKLDDIKCTYDPEYGCRPPRLVRLQKKIDLTQTALDNYETFSKEIKKPNTRFTSMKEYYLNILRLDTVDDVDEEDTDTTKEYKSKRTQIVLNPKQTHDTVFTIIQILNKIMLIPNDSNRIYLIYKLIEKDGILIGNYIYSKKYESRLLCGHWYFLRLEDQADSNDRREKMRTRLLNQFGDNGKASHGIECCKICGNYLSDIAYDDSEGFDKDGHLIRSRQVLEEEIDSEEEINTLVDNVLLFCQGVGFKKDLQSQKIETDKLLMDGICEILHSLMLKLNIGIYKKHIIEIFVDTLPFIKHIIRFDKFKQLELTSLQKKGISLQKIDLLNERGYFADKYQTYSMTKKYAIIAARLLITLQTAIPPYQISKPLTDCALSGLDGDNGTNFILCILEELSDTQFKKKNVETYRASVRKQFTEVYNELISHKNIQALYDERVAFMKKVSRKNTRAEIFSDIRLKEYKIDKLTPGQLQNYNTVLRRLRYLSLLLQELVHTAVKKSNPNNPSAVENTCCMVEAAEYGVYWNFLDKIAFDYLEEMQMLSKIARSFLRRGVYHREILKPTITEKTINSIPFMIKDSDTKLIEELFLSYCSVGNTKGQLHVWINNKCLKCKKSMEDIKENTYKIADVNTLMNDISRNNFNIMTIKDISPNKIYKKLSESVNKNDLDNLNVTIHSFVDKLAKIISKKFDKEKYINIITNLGNLNNVYDEKIRLFKRTESTPKPLPTPPPTPTKTSKIKVIKGGVIKTEIKNADTCILDICNEREYTRIALLKQYINVYFRRNISIIQNNAGSAVTDRVSFDLETLDISKTVAEELQKIIYTDNARLTPFLNACNIFQKLVFDYTIDEINSINGKIGAGKAEGDSLHYTLKDASNLLIYLLITQLNKFLSYVPEEQIKQTYCQKVGEFIVMIFDQIAEETAYIDVPDSELLQYELSIQYDRDKKTTTKAEITEWEYIFGKFHDEIEDAKDTADLNLDLIQKDKEADIVSKIEAKYMKQFGEKPDAALLADLKDEYMKDLAAETDEFDQEYDLKQAHEGLEVLEEGDDYGLPEQGTEHDETGVDYEQG